uniref:Uncharacterized protein n=1 Tax=Anopheles minimus TaxID=112268 RepID=A0A182WMS0_9DIPT
CKKVQFQGSTLVHESVLPFVFYFFFSTTIDFPSIPCISSTPAICFTQTVKARSEHENKSIPRQCA